MTIDINGIVIICGNYGSGKTETAVNLAAVKKKDGMTVSIADLDLVNPYFRARKARQILEAMGINVVLPDTRYLDADLPILTPAVAGIIGQAKGLTILDAGGDDVGVTVLAALSEYLGTKPVNMLQVINPFRPFTETVEGCLKIQKDIERASGLTMTGIIGNANLLDETSCHDIDTGYEFVKEVSSVSELPLKFITAPKHLIPSLSPDKFPCPVLPINRTLNPPWKLTNA